jgi:hypothetical protein
VPSPRVGPCSPWCSGPAVAALPWMITAAAKAISAGSLDQPQVDAICAESAAAASEILYELSAHVYTGECGPVTIRPVARPTDSDTRSVVSSSIGSFSSVGYASAYGSQQPGVAVHYGSVEPPTIKLPYPVTQITLVKIDGVVIPADEYELRAFQDLVRIRPSAASTPTDRWGWPTSQIMDLPDTQAGTFSVSFMFGISPPAAGRLAARKLAEYLALPQLGDSTHYPRRTTQVSRQGVTTQTTDPTDILKTGSLGIEEVDVFILAVNPKKLQRPPTVWSPDVGRARRQANPSLS